MVLKKWGILAFAPPGNCKSLEQAFISYKLLREYKKIEKKYPQLQKRFLYSDEKFSEPIRYRFLQRWRDPYLFTHSLEDGHLRYWNRLNLNTLRYCPIRNCWKSSIDHPLHDCDILCGEAMMVFPATMRGAIGDVEEWLREMLIMHRHRSLRFYFLTQDIAGVNIIFRRTMWEAWAMEKKIGSRDPSPSLPPVKHIWGFYQRRLIDPDLARRDSMDIRLMIKIDEKTPNKEKENTDIRLKLIGSPKIRWISRFKCSLYDTLEDKTKH